MKKTKIKIFLTIFFLFLGFKICHAQAVNLYLAPASGKISVGKTFNVTLGAQGFNNFDSVEVKVNYPPDKLEIVSISPSTNFELWMKKTFDNGSGTAYFIAATTSGGYSNAFIANLNFRAKKEGEARVDITYGRAAFQGKEVPANLSGAFYKLVKIAPVVKKEKVEEKPKKEEIKKPVEVPVGGEIKEEKKVKFPFWLWIILAFISGVLIGFIIAFLIKREKKKGVNLQKQGVDRLIYLDLDGAPFKKIKIKS